MIEVVNRWTALYGPRPTEVRAATLTEYTVLETRDENEVCSAAVLRKSVTPPG